MQISAKLNKMLNILLLWQRQCFLMLQARVSRTVHNSSVHNDPTNYNAEASSDHNPAWHNLSCHIVLA